MNTRSLIFFFNSICMWKAEDGGSFIYFGYIFFINGKVVTPEGDFFFFFSLDFLLYGSKNMVP